MKKNLPFFKSIRFGLVTLSLVLTSIVNGQTDIALDNFETVASFPSFGFVFSGGGYVTGSTQTWDKPASTAYASLDTRAYEVNGGTATLTSGPLNTTSHNFVTFRLNVMAVTLFGLGGLDATDFIRVEVSPNNGTNWYNTVEVTGNSGAWWNHSATGNANTSYDGNTTPVVFTPASGGQRTTDGFTTINISNLPKVAQLRIRITMTNTILEQWVIDNARLIGTTIAPLPVKLSNIKAYEKQSGVQIDWTAYSEENLNKYQVERSENGQNFTAIGDIASRNSAVETNYDFFDANPLPGVNFYRLRNIDMDGKSGLSSVVKINMDKSVKDITLYPNPVRGGYVSFQSSNLTKGIYTVRVTNVAGQQVYNQLFKHNGGAINQTIQLPVGTRSGLYTIQLDSEMLKVMSKTFIVQ